MLNEIKIGALLIIGWVVIEAEASTYDSSSSLPLLNSNQAQYRDQVIECIDQMVGIMAGHQLPSGLRQRINSMQIDWDMLFLQNTHVELSDVVLTRAETKECEEIDRILDQLKELECRKALNIQFDESIISMIRDTELITWLKASIVCQKTIEQSIIKQIDKEFMTF